MKPLNRVLTAGLIAVTMGGTAHAQNEQINLEQLRARIDELIGKYGGDKLVDDLVIDVEGIEEKFLLSVDAQNQWRLEPVEDMGAPTLALRRNQGRCTALPIDFGLVRDKGFYVIEFCNHATPNVAWGDHHRLGSSAGSVGQFLNSLAFRCDVPAEYAEMTNKARRAFCRD